MGCYPRGKLFKGRAVVSKGYYIPETATAKKTAELMKKAAEEYIFDPYTEIMLAPRHWGEFPGKTEVGFTKTLGVSAPYGKS